MVECHQPEQKSVEALENWDFVYDLISRRLPEPSSTDHHIPIVRNCDVSEPTSAHCFKS